MTDNFLHKEPSNYYFWMLTLKRPEELELFLKNGTDIQKNNIKKVLLYVKKINRSLFKELNGKEILERLKNAKIN